MLRLCAAPLIVAAFLCQPAVAASCPSIDSTLEAISRGGGDHRLLDPPALSKAAALFNELDGRSLAADGAMMVLWPDGGASLLFSRGISTCWSLHFASSNSARALVRTLIGEGI